MDTLEIPVVTDGGPNQPFPPITPHRLRRFRWAPQDRPPAAARAFVGLVAGAAMLVTAALLLSDRAPGILRTLFGDRARELWERVDAGTRLDASVGSATATQPDFLVHVALWAIITGLVGIAVWTWRGLLIGIVTLIVVSIVLEVAQGRFASTRAVQASDAAGNLVGIALGATTAGVCFVVWSCLAAIGRRIRRART